MKLLRCPPLVFACLALVLSGCTTVPANLLALPPQSDQVREQQSRQFADMDETALLAASASVVQDLGFTLDESESRLGIITASRRLTSRRPPNGGEVLAGLAYTVMIPYLGAPMLAYKSIAGVKEPQVVRVTLVTRATDASSRRSAALRVTAQRYVYANEKYVQVKLAESLDDPQFYAEFFQRLEHSVFLEKQSHAL
jgi:hypothetical protein